MKVVFDVWENAKGELHLTSNDPRLPNPVNIRAREGLASTRSLREALHATSSPLESTPQH